MSGLATVTHKEARPDDGRRENTNHVGDRSRASLVPHVVAAVGVRSSLKQCVRDVLFPLLGRKVQRCHAVVVRNSRVCAAVKKELHHVQVALLGGPVRADLGRDKNRRKSLGKGKDDMKDTKGHGQSGSLLRA